MAHHISHITSYTIHPTPYASSTHYIQLPIIMIYLGAIGAFLGIFFTIVYLWPVTRVVKLFVDEKESRIKVLCDAKSM